MSCFFCSLPVHDDKAKAKLNSSNRYAISFVKIYWLSLCGTGLYFMIAPIIRILWAKLGKTELILELPMPMR